MIGDRLRTRLVTSCVIIWGLSDYSRARKSKDGCVVAAKFSSPNCEVFGKLEVICIQLLYDHFFTDCKQSQ